MSTPNKFDKLRRNPDGVIVTDSGYWVVPRTNSAILGKDGIRWVLCWDTLNGGISSRSFNTLLSLRRAIARADGNPHLLPIPLDEIR